MLWQALAGGGSVEAAARRLARRFGLPLEQALADCRRTAAAFARLAQNPPSPPAMPIPSTHRTPAPAAPGCAYRIAGQVFTLDAEPRLQAQLANVIGHLRCAAAPPARAFSIAVQHDGFVLAADGREWSRSKTLAGLQYRLMQAVAALALEAPGRLAWLHAGAVLHRERCPAPETPRWWRV